MGGREKRREGRRGGMEGKGSRNTAPSIPAYAPGRNSSKIRTKSCHCLG